MAYKLMLFSLGIKKEQVAGECEKQLEKIYLIM
jgi:hypothetical protein